MLPSRGIARSIAPRGLSNRLAAPRRLQANTRRFGTLLRSNGSSQGARPSLRAGQHAAAPVVLGGVSSSRSLSLWGYGKKTPPAEDAVPATADKAAAGTGTSTAPAEPGTTSAAAPAASAPDTNSVSATEIDTSSISDIINGQDILNMPEQLGYLKAIGLDYGVGPTSVMQWALEHIHVWSGLGWGTTIVATAVLLRTIMFYPQVRSLKFTAIMQQMKKDPRSNEAMKLVQEGFQESDPEKRQKGQVLNKLLREQYNVSNWGILWSFMQIPFTFGLFRIVSGMTHIPVPSLETAGYLWFSDLTATDPYFILPAAGTGLMILALLLNSKHTPAQQKKMLKPLMYIFGTVGFVGTTFLSAAVNLMTVALGFSTLVTAVILNNPTVRRSFDLPMVADDAAPKTTAAAAQYEAPRAAPANTGFRERMTSSLGDMKKGLTDQVNNYTGTYSGSEQEKAERKRRELLRKLEDNRKQQERDEFEKKYKGRR